MLKNYPGVLKRVSTHTISVSGSDFSLPKVLQLVEKERQTGLLTLIDSPGEAATPIFYIWVERGRLVAAAKSLEDQGLIKLIEQRQWISDRVFDKLIHWCRPIDQPLGTYLRNQGVLRPEQLKQLFNLQVIQPVNALFYLKQGQLQFLAEVRAPKQEMTGLSISAAALKLFILPEDAKALRTTTSSNFNRQSLTYRNRSDQDLVG